MKTGLFIIIVLISGGFAGLIHGGINLAIVEPYLDQGIGIENKGLKIGILPGDSFEREEILPPRFPLEKGKE